MKSYIDEMMVKGFICLLKWSAGAPCIFVRKEDGERWMCVNYRKLNAITIKNCYPIPPLDGLLGSLSEGKIFSKINLCLAYNLLRIAEGLEHKTAFCTCYGLFEWLVMPFGLTNAPLAFRHFINDVLSDMVNQHVVIYLDNILIFLKTQSNHNGHVCNVLRRLSKFNMFCKASKCEFDRQEIKFLGFVVGVAGLKPDPFKISPIAKWPTPQTVKHVQSFLGFATFYRRFIASYSKIVYPLTQLTKKDVVFEWNSKCAAAFKELKEAFTSEKVLAHFDPALKTMIETDTSDHAIGMILLQVGDDGVMRPITFDSKSLLSAQLNYKIHDKEMLAIITALIKWRMFLHLTSDRFNVMTNNRLLEYIMTSKQLNRRQAWWNRFLADFDFDIRY